MTVRFALGFGNNIDYEMVWNSRHLEALIAEYDIRDHELNVDRVIHRERDLVISILSFLKISGGGERFVASSDMIERFSQRFEHKITLGGTSVRAAQVLHSFGYSSALHLVTLNDSVRRLLPPDCVYVSSAAEDSFYPHLIVQFGPNTRIDANDIRIRTSQANRLIYHCDTDNITMRINTDFARLTSDAQVLLISGMNAMRSEVLLTERLEAITHIIDTLPKKALVYYEDAGFPEPQLRHVIVRRLARHIDIYSMNEDELQAYLHRQIDLLNVEQVKLALEELQQLIAVPVIVIHSRYWAIAISRGASRFSAALRAGVAMATTRYCCGDAFSAEMYAETARRAPAPAQAAFAQAIRHLPGDRWCCAPVPQVEPAHSTSVGLGDAFVGGFLLALVDPVRAGFA